MIKAWLTIGAFALCSIGFGQFASTDTSTLPEFSIYHPVLEWVNSTGVNATNQTIAHHFPGQALPSIIYAEQDDSSIHVVHQQAPFEFSAEVLPVLPELDYTTMRTRQMDAGHSDWYLMALNPSRIICKEGLLTDAPADTLISSDAVWVNFEVIDINGDGSDELITVEYGNNGKIIAWADSNGTFVAQDTIGLAAYATHLHAFDLNYDAIPDFIVPGTPLRIFTSTNGTWELTASALGRGNADFADLDGDYDIDVATTDYYGLTWSQIRNELNGTFDITTAIADTSSDQWYGQVCRIADVTGDGAPDILLTRAIDNTIYLWRNGLDEMNDLVELTPAGQAGVRHVSLVDMDLDGDLDWLGAGPYQHIGVLENTQIKFGCTYPFAINYTELANADDGSCTFDPNGCSNCPADLDGDFQIGTTDLLLMLSNFGQSCPEPETPEWGCGDPVNYHGYDYSTVQIGDQCWFAENLRTEYFQNGESIPGEIEEDEWEYQLYGPATAIYGELGYCTHLSPTFDACNSDLALEEYGRLYNGFAVLDDRELCPVGFHIPSDNEFMELEAFIGIPQDSLELWDGLRGQVAPLLKSTTGWYEGENGSNSIGFNAVPADMRYCPGNYQGAGRYARFWTSTTQMWGQWGGNIWGRMIFWNEVGVYRSPVGECQGMSVRCIQDSE